MIGSIGKQFYNKPTRAEYSLSEFPECFETTILDVGAGGSVSYYKQILGDRYSAVDFNESRDSPDYFINLESDDLPFGDSEYDTVICMDCLEHLERIHEMFDEIQQCEKSEVKSNGERVFLRGVG
jgi:2-polyprenyl-3-methyl-5-hydroxy-6-metoxy-1,4-benzoquinol methylase